MPSCGQFHSPGLHGLLDKLYDLIGYFLHLRKLFIVNPGHSYICPSCFTFVEAVLCNFFSRQRKLIVFLWSLSDTMSPRVSGTPLGSLANLKKYSLDARPPISNSSSSLIKFSVIVPSAPINYYHGHLNVS